ncbi:hypothetical protein niasHT_009581 [Heterodera trifolii]|uniref:polynucleotide adenylyltransferase n=1 Tax=Heterodera trifolii TaxID=157864 RepID=A0ABD2M5B4_9BILA
MAQEAEHRFAISLLLGYFKLRLAVKLNVGTTQATDTRMALGIMRSQVYSKIDNAEGLCWMMHLAKFVDGGGTFILPPEPLIFDCIVNDGKVPQFEQIRERIQKWHYEFLSSKQNDIPFVSVFTKRSVAGTVTRLKQLLGKKLFDKLYAKYPQMCQYPGNGRAIYNFELTSGVLKQFLITYRHCDDPQKLNIVWEKLIKQIETELERFYSAGGNEKQEQQRHNPVGTEARVLLNQLHADQLKRMLLNQVPMVKSNGEEHEKTEEKYDPIEEFATLMKKGLSSMMEARILLSDFVGTKEVDNILRIVGIESKFDDLNDALLGKENGTNIGESSKNNKKKKKKAKKAKKEQNGEKENGKETKNTSEDKISHDKMSAAFDETNKTVKGDKVSTKNRKDQQSKDKVSTKDQKNQQSEEKVSTKNREDQLSGEKVPTKNREDQLSGEKVPTKNRKDQMSREKVPTKNWENQINWLARTLLSNGEMANAWEKLGKDSQTQAITLEQILTTNGHGLLDTNKAQEINENFNKIRTVIKEWSKGQSDLLLSGSMMLDAFTMDSDVDTICVSPEHIQSDQFFGTVPCHQKFDEKCRNDDSLFCRLCFHPEVHSLQRIQSNWVPLIRLKLINFDHEIDIVFASIPGEQQIDADELRQQNILTKIEEMIEKLDNKIKQLKEEEDRNDQASLPNAKEQMLKSLRSLAANYIYNNAMGFFNGTSLGVLAAKIVLLYPEATVPFLLERFFFSYSSWEWPLPVQIAEIRPNSSLNWNAWDEQKHLLSQYGSGGAYSKLMIPYSQYFAIICVASDSNMFNEFCGFVVTRIRVQLTRLNDCTRDDVGFLSRDFTKRLSTVYCTKIHKNVRSSKIYCKTWLVGVKKKNDTQIQSQKSKVGEHLQQNDNKLKQELDKVIVNSYKFIGLGGGRRGGANLNLAEQKIQKHFARNNLFQGTDEADNQRDFVNLESEYVDKQIVADLI